LDALLDVFLDLTHKNPVLRAVLTSKYSNAQAVTHF
jgi:hypothetical protein